jgi:purine-binding chemotaxis protein CheW
MTDYVVVVTERGRQLVRVTHIQEIVSLMALTHVDGLRGNCRGMANLRGEIIPVFDLDGPQVPLSPARFILVIRLAAGPVGLIVNEIQDVVAIADELLAQRPTGGGRAALLATVGEEVLAVLEPQDAIDAAS